MDTEENVQFLIIDEVRSRRFLWDLRHDDYKNVLKKKEAWLQIAELCSTATKKYPAETVEKYWRNLRDRAKKLAKKTVIKPTGDSASSGEEDTAELEKTKWPYWIEMQFVLGKSSNSKQVYKLVNVVMGLRRSSVLSNSSSHLDRPRVSTDVTNNDDISSTVSPLVIGVRGSEHSYLSQAMQHRLVSSISPASEEASTSSAVTSKPSKRKRTESAGTVDDHIMEMMVDEFSTLGTLVADTLRRANAVDKVIYKEARKAILNMLNDIDDKIL